MRLHHAPCFFTRRLSQKLDKRKEWSNESMKAVVVEVQDRMVLVKPCNFTKGKVDLASLRPSILVYWMVLVKQNG